MAQVPRDQARVNGGSICDSLYVAVPPATMSRTRWRGDASGPAELPGSQNLRAPTFQKWDFENFSTECRFSSKLQLSLNLETLHLAYLYIMTRIAHIYIFTVIPLISAPL